MPSLIPLTFENKTLLNRANYLLVHKTGSHASLYQDVYGVYRFTATINETPDQLINRCKTTDGYQDPLETQKVVKQIDDFIGDLHAEGLEKKYNQQLCKGCKGAIPK